MRWAGCIISARVAGQENVGASFCGAGVKGGRSWAPAARGSTTQCCGSKGAAVDVAASVGGKSTFGGGRTALLHTGHTASDGSEQF